MKKIFILAVLGLLVPVFVFAKTSFSVLDNENTLSLQGKCMGDQVRVDLFAGKDAEPIYTSGAPCQDGNFTFSDDLTKWEGIPNGDYTLAVDNDKSNTPGVRIKRVVEQRVDPVPAPAAPAPEATLSTGTPASQPDSPEVKFLNAFVALQQSILDMREWLTATTYPIFLKSGLAMALDGIETAANTVSDLIVAHDSSASAGENKTADAASPTADTPTNTPAETPTTLTPADPASSNTPDPVVAPTEPTQPTVSDTTDQTENNTNTSASDITGAAVNSDGTTATP
jgi:hypothetical protein